MMATTITLQHHSRMSSVSMLYRQQARRLLTSARSLSSQADAAAPSRRSTRSRSEGVDADKVNLVGPPDPISNIRPVLYAPPKGTGRQPEPSSSGGPAARPTAQVHPYSVSEFNQTASSSRTASSRRPRGLGIFPSYRDYIDRVCDRVEEVDMKLRLAQLTTDSTTQRFWRDNNQRFNRDMQSWSQGQESMPTPPKQIEGTVAPLSTSTSTSLPSAPAAQAKDVVVGASSESDFYATWLRANGKRNRAYNVLVWRQAFEQVRLGAQVNLWRGWLRLLRRLEG